MELQLQHHPSNEYSGLISFRIDSFDLLAVQGTLKSLIQHHSSKTPILWHLAFFMAQLSHPYITTGKTVALTIQTFVSKVISLLFNTLSRFVIAFLPRSKHLLISWLQSPYACFNQGSQRIRIRMRHIDIHKKKIIGNGLHAYGSWKVPQSAIWRGRGVSGVVESQPEGLSFRG